MEVEELKRISYEFWCKKLQKHLDLSFMPSIKEYKNEIEYQGITYKKELWR